jgi:hypothetical protein
MFLKIRRVVDYLDRCDGELCVLFSDDPTVCKELRAIHEHYRQTLMLELNRILIEKLNH